jgi:hypothetical protein
VPHGTPGLGPRERLLARSVHYLVFGVLFLGLYGAVVRFTGGFPEWLLLAILGGSLLKDLYDEVRLRRGGQPLAYAGIEHTPSNLVLLVFVLLDVLEPTGTVLGVPVEPLVIGLAVVDTVFDLWQDARA